MTTESIYRLCTRAFETCEDNPHKLRAQLRELAGVMGCVLPVVRAAEDLAAADVPSEMSPEANSYRVILRGKHNATLIRSVFEMRERLARLP